MWGKVSCLRKQRAGRDWALNHQASDLKSNLLTTIPPHPHHSHHAGSLLGKQNHVTLHRAILGFTLNKGLRCWW